MLHHSSRRAPCDSVVASKGITQVGWLLTDLAQQQKKMGTRKMNAGDFNNISNTRVNGAAIQRDLGVGSSNAVSGVNCRVFPHNVNTRFSLWEGHLVNSEYVELLQKITIKYPQTFERFTHQSEMIYCMGLTTLCTSLSDYFAVSKTSLNPLLIMHYRRRFTDLESWGFNTTWLLNCLKNDDEICSIDNRINEILRNQNGLDSAHKAVQELLAIRAAKKAQIQEAIGAFGPNMQSCR